MPPVTEGIVTLWPIGIAESVDNVSATIGDVDASISQQDQSRDVRVSPK